MKFESVKVILGAALMASAGCYAGVPTGQEDTDAASSDTDGEGEGGGPGGGSDDESGESGETGDSGDPDSGGDNPADPPEPPDGCLAGSIGCECLNNECMGLSTCIDDVCTPAPPVPDVDGPSAAIAGVAIALDGAINVPNELDGQNVFESLLWEQVSGPEADLEYEFSTEAVAWIPPGANDNAELTFRLTAELGGVVESGEYTLSVLPAQANEILADSMGVPEFGAVLMGRGADSVWLSTDLGLVARLGDKGIDTEEDLTSRVTQIRGYGNNLVLFTQPDLGRVMEFNGNNNQYTEFLSELTSGDPLGPVVSMAPGPDGDLYFGTEDMRIVLYDDPDDAEPAVTLDRFTVAQVPTAMTIGQHPVAPDDDDDDEGVVLYYGTDTGDVWQIGLTEAEVLDGPEVGTPTQYVTLPGTGPVTGILVDNFRNMWVGKGDTLYLVRRRFDTEPSVVREISAPGGLGGFAGLHASDDDRLDWVDPTSGNVARLQTYEE